MTDRDPAIAEAFERWYRAYPRKKARAAALRAYTKALRGSATPDQLLAGLRRAQFDEDRPQFIPYPATWLNGERWLDVPDRAPGEKQDEEYYSHGALGPAMPAHKNPNFDPTMFSHLYGKEED